MKHRRLTRRKLFYPLIFACGVAASGCNENGSAPLVDLSERLDNHETTAAANHNTTPETVYRFGFDLRASPQEDARQYLPFLDYLKRSTGYDFKLHFTAADRHIIDDLGNNVVQFAAIGASSYILAKQRYNAIPIARGLNHENKAEYRSALIVASDSPIKRIADLKGKRMAFGNITSTQGHLIPRIILSEHRLELSDLAGYEYTGSHSHCADAVISGRSDVCGMQDTMAQHLAAQGLVEILHLSDYFPSSGIAANQNIAPEVIDKLKEALLAFAPQGRHAPGLYHWDRTEMPNGFVTAKDEDYDKLRYWSVTLGIVEFTAPPLLP